LGDNPKYPQGIANDGFACWPMRFVVRYLL
jgi:hypothetical protein